MLTDEDDDDDDDDTPPDPCPSFFVKEPHYARAFFSRDVEGDDDESDGAAAGTED